MAEEITIDLSNPETVKVPQWAKEETQLAIKDLLSGKGPAKGLGKELKDAGKGAKSFDQTLKNAIPGPAKLASSAMDAAGSLLNFGTTVITTMLTTKGSLTDLNKILDASADVIENTLGKIPLLGPVITFFSQKAIELQKQVNIAFENLASNFEGASAAGASFGGNLTAFGNKTLDANVNFGKFNQIVNDNNGAFAALGGTVTQGAERFLRLNKMVTEATDGTVRNFRGLGLTLEDVASLNADILEINSRNYQFQRLSEADQAIAMQNTIANFATLGRLTGKRAEQVAEEIKEATTRGDVAAGLANLDAESLQEYGKLNQVLKQFGPNVEEAGAQLAAGLGTVTGDAATTFGLLGDPARSALERVTDLIRTGADPKQIQSATADLEQALRDATKSEEFRSVAVLGSVSTTANLAADVYSNATNLIANQASSQDRFTDAVNETADALALEDGLTNSILGTKAALEGASLELNENFLKLLTGPKGLGAVIQEVQAQQNKAVSAMEDFINKYLQVDEAQKPLAEKFQNQDSPVLLKKADYQNVGFGRVMGGIPTNVDFSNFMKPMDTSGMSQSEIIGQARGRGEMEKAFKKLGFDPKALINAADTNKSGGLDDSELTKLVETMNALIEGNEHMARHMKKVDKTLIKGLNVRLE